MAALAQIGHDAELRPKDLPNPRSQFSNTQLMAANLYSSGHRRNVIAAALERHLLRPQDRERPEHQRKVIARRRLVSWERNQKFRDLVWELSVGNLDMQTPAILKGVARKARAGRVDAARLSLEVTGRHNPKGDGVPTQIAIVVNGIPRPDRAVEAEGRAVLELET